MAKRHPNKRLKKLRQIIHFTQREFASEIGVSYAYILAVETGQRALSSRLAERIMLATGVNLTWLKGNPTLCPDPTTWSDEFFTKDFYLTWGKKWIPKKDRDKLIPAPLYEIDPDGDDSCQIDRYCDSLASLMRAALRNNRLPVCVFYLREMLKTSSLKLKLGSPLLTEIPDGVPDWLFSEEAVIEFPNDQLDEFETQRLWQLLARANRLKWGFTVREKLSKHDNLTPGDVEEAGNRLSRVAKKMIPSAKDWNCINPIEMDHAWRMLSPSAKFKWSDSMKGSSKKKLSFILELENLRRLVEGSYTAKKAKNRKR